MNEETWKPKKMLAKKAKIKMMKKNHKNWEKVGSVLLKINLKGFMSILLWVPKDSLHYGSETRIDDLMVFVFF